MDLPIRIEFFGDEIDSLRSFDPTDQRTTGKVERAVLLPASEFLLPSEGVAAIRDRLGRAASRLSESASAVIWRGSKALPMTRFAPSPNSRASHGPSRSVTPPRCGRRTSRRRPASITSTTGTVLILDEPGDIAEAAGFLWRQADERRAELVDAGELPKDWLSTYLPPRDWKSRLVASRTLELTWESEPAVDVAMAGGARGSGDLFGWREPTLPLGRAGRSVRRDRCAGARRAPGSSSPPTRRRGSPRSSRRPATASAWSIGSRRRHHPGRSRWSAAASTAVSAVGRTASRSSRTASCSGRSGSADPRPFAGSCRATCSSA